MPTKKSSKAVKKKTTTRSKKGASPKKGKTSSKKGRVAGKKRGAAAQKRTAAARKRSTAAKKRSAGAQKRRTVRSRTTRARKGVIAARRRSRGVIGGTVVIDPGHGGTTNIDGSDANHAVSPSGVLEKNLTLDIALRARDALQQAAPQVNVVLTRSTDVNLGLSARANVARANRANLFLSIHFNGFNKVARGIEALVRPVDRGNVNHAEDVAFARRVQSKVLAALKARDSGTRDRGVKDQVLGVLRDDQLGNTAANHPCKACLLEVEFIDVPAVDVLLNTGPQAETVRNEIASAIKDAIIEQLQS